MRGPSGPTPGSSADDQPDADPEQVARTIVLRRLTAAPRSRADLRSDLLRRGVPEQVADKVLDRFTEVGLIDDAAYARAWVDSRQRTRGSARPVLRAELRNKGIADEDAEQALAGVDEESERARAVQLVGARLRTMSRLAPDVRRRRLVSLLVRRGYRQSTALSVVREVLSDQPDQAEADPVD